GITSQAAPGSLFPTRWSENVFGNDCGNKTTGFFQTDERIRYHCSRTLTDYYEKKQCVQHRTLIAYRNDGPEKQCTNGKIQCAYGRNSHEALARFVYSGWG